MRRGSGNISCPKCHGNVFFEREASYNFVRQQNELTGWCLQCGYTLYLRADTASEDRVSTSVAKK